MKGRRHFRRNITRSYPVRLLPEDLRGEFKLDDLVTIKVEALEGIESGNAYVEAVFAYKAGDVVQQSKTVLIWP